jgi:hypothetical protein
LKISALFRSVSPLVGERYFWSVAGTEKPLLRKAFAIFAVTKQTNKMNTEKSKCPKCGNDSFEMKSENVGVKEELLFVRCSNVKCLTAIGVIDRGVTTHNLLALESKLNDALFKLDIIKNQHQ